ncbi:MAG: hypothetical protein RL357_532 [Pseudomonadota bacterium]
MSRLAKHILALLRCCLYTRAIDRRLFGWAVLRQCAGVMVVFVLGSQAPVQAAEQDLSVWLKSLHDAPLKHTYQGTMVINVDAQMVTARIAHALEEGVPVERVDVLTGQSRTSFRHGSRVITLWPESKRWVSESREDLGVFPGATGVALERVSQFYRLKDLGDDRVAGRKVRAFEIFPSDDMRWGYRVWRDQNTHLIVKIQTLSTQPQQVLEQSAFTTLETGQTVDAAPILRDSQPPQGYEVSQLEVRPVRPETMGLRYVAGPPGFLPMRAQLPKDQQAPQPQLPLQWLFSDGLASVSVFYEPSAHVGAATVERAIRQGATHTLLRETQDMRLTLVGEVPLQTLVQIANGIRLDR